MVFFSCDGCGDMLKKAQVDNHVYKCRDECESVSCVDCSVKFYGDDYRAHTSCVTEAERYEKTVYRGPKKDGSNIQNGNKKLSAQEAWVFLLSNAGDTAPPSIQSHVEQLSTLDNVPRKEKQFRNFIANSLRINKTVVDDIWGHLSGLREEEKKRREAQATANTPKPSNPKSEPPIDNAVAIDTEKDGDSSVDGEMDSSETEISPKVVAKTIKKALKKAPNRTMKVKELRRVIETKILAKKEKRSAMKEQKRIKSELKRMILNQINDCSKQMKIEGKLVTLLK